jgi:hypothetical protein
MTNSSLSYSLLAIGFVVTAGATDPNTFNYTNPADPYRPDQYVNIGHLFSRSEVSYEKSYYERDLLIIPLVIFILGVLSLFFLNVGLLFRCCCLCCKCLPTINSDVAESENLAKFKRNRTVILVFFYMFCLFALAADQLSWIGNVAVSKGVDNVKESINGLKTIFIALSADAASLVKLAVTLRADFNSAVATCPQINNLQQYIPAYENYAGSYLSAINGIPGDLNDLNDKIDFYAVYYRNIAFYLIWALAIFSILSMVLWQLCKKVIMLKLSMFIGMLTYCLEIVVTLVFMIVTSLTADICSPSPSYNFVRLAPVGDFKNLLSYYTSCVGPNVIGGYLDSAISAINQIKQGLQQAKDNAQCLNNQGIAAMQNDLSQIVDIFANIELNFLCPNIRSLWFNMVNTGLCKNLYTGFYSIWISQLVTSFFVLLTILMASFAYHYFDIYAKEKRPEEHHQVVVKEHPQVVVEEHHQVEVASAPLPPTSPTYTTTGIARHEPEQKM